jgi:predicted nucleotide-binding protein
VVLELVYFLGKLKRNRVCALYKEGVEIPSDYQGVLYVELDFAGGWTIKLA